MLAVHRCLNANHGVFSSKILYFVTLFFFILLFEDKGCFSAANLTDHIKFFSFFSLLFSFHRIMNFVAVSFNWFWLNFFLSRSKLTSIVGGDGDGGNNFSFICTWRHSISKNVPLALFHSFWYLLLISVLNALSES